MTKQINIDKTLDRGESILISLEFFQFAFNLCPPTSFDCVQVIRKFSVSFKHKTRFYFLELSLCNNL